MCAGVALQTCHHLLEFEPPSFTQATQRAMSIQHGALQLGSRWRLSGDRLGDRVWDIRRWKEIERLIEAHAAQYDVDILVARDDHAIGSTQVMDLFVHARHEAEVRAVQRLGGSEEELDAIQVASNAWFSKNAPQSRCTVAYEGLTLVLPEKK